MSIQSISSASPPPLAELRASANTSGSPVPQATPAGQASAAAAAVGRPGAVPASTQQTERQPAESQSDIRQALDEVRDALSPVAQNLLFSIDDDTGKTVIRIIDSSTDEVIKQIPSEEILAIAKALDKLQGLLIKQAV